MNETIQGWLRLAVLCASLFAAAEVGDPGSDDELVGLWWGGLQFPGEFETVLLHIEATDSGLTVRASRPRDGIGGELMEVIQTRPKLLVRREQDGGVMEIELELQNGELLRGAARLGPREVPLILRRTERVDARDLDALLGDYRSESGERVRIDRLPASTRFPALVCSWAQARQARTLVAVGPDEFVFGPDFERVGPTEGRVIFDRSGDEVVLTWERVDGSGESAERFPMSVDEGRVDALVEAELARSGAPSFSVGIVHGQELVYARSFGVLNRETQEPATPESLYQIASVTKVFTAMLLMAMRDEGLVALDDPVGRYLPQEQDSALLRSITLRQLVTHTSGLRLQPNNYVFNGRHNDDYSVEGLYACLPEMSLQYPPGSSWSYSNLGFVLLGHALARAGGASYEELLGAKVLDPLGMHASTITLDEKTRSRLATHYWEDDPQTATPPWIPGEIAAQGGLTSNVRDLARFLSASFLDECVQAGALSGASLRELQAPAVPRRDGNDGWLGLGWFRDHDPRSGLLLSHSGYTGGSSSYVAFSPGLEVGVIVLSNFGFDPVVRLGTSLIELAVEGVRAETLPTEYEAQTFARDGDWSNAAWAFGVLAELDPDGPWAGESERAAGRAGLR